MSYLQNYHNKQQNDNYIQNNCHAKIMKIIVVIHRENFSLCCYTILNTPKLLAIYYHQCKPSQSTTLFYETTNPF